MVKDLNSLIKLDLSSSPSARSIWKYSMTMNKRDASRHRKHLIQTLARCRNESTWTFVRSSLPQNRSCRALGRVRHNNKEWWWHTNDRRGKLTCRRLEVLVQRLCDRCQRSIRPWYMACQSPTGRALAHVGNCHSRIVTRSRNHGSESTVSPAIYMAL